MFDSAGDKPSVARSLKEEGFVFLRADEMRPLVEQVGSLADWHSFRESWDTLALDPYLAETRRQRRRRHAVYSISTTGEIVREPHQTHYQALEYNALQGGIARSFEPVPSAIGEGECMSSLLALARDTFTPLHAAPSRWHVEAHQMRIEATDANPGEPTPEGVHRDGVDYVLVLLIARRNISSGTTTIFTPTKRPLGAFTLTVPFDAALIDDTRVWHGVTAVRPLVATQAAYRDVLVLTLKAVPERT